MFPFRIPLMRKSNFMKVVTKAMMTEIHLKIYLDARMMNGYNEKFRNELPSTIYFECCFNCIISS